MNNIEHETIVDLMKPIQKFFKETKTPFLFLAGPFNGDEYATVGDGDVKEIAELMIQHSRCNQGFRDALGAASYCFVGEEFLKAMNGLTSEMEPDLKA